MIKTNLKSKRRIQKTRRMSEIMKDAAVVTNSSSLNNTIVSDVHSVNDAELIISTSPKMCNKAKLNRKRFVPRKRLLSDIMNTTIPITNFSSHPNTTNDEGVCSFPPCNTFCEDVIFPADLVNPVSSTISPPPTITFTNDNGSYGRNLELTDHSNSHDIGCSALVNAVSKEVRVLSSLVKVDCVHFQTTPLQMKKKMRTYTSGFVIKGRKVLTSAHAVSHYTHVMLSKKSSDIKYVATVLAIGAQCDIGEDLELGLRFQGSMYVHFIWLIKSLFNYLGAQTTAIVDLITSG